MLIVKLAVRATSLTLMMGLGMVAAGAQELESSSVSAMSLLPDAPSSAGVGALEYQQTVGTGKGTFPRKSGKYDTVILPGQEAARLNVHDKILYGIKDSVSPFSLIGIVVSAGYEQVTDGSPNYGVIGNTKTGKSFAQRLGAAAARDTSETIFAESILAPILHEDPRYYKMGSGHNFLKRLTYSGTRAIFTRTDGGHQTINFSSLGGNLGGSALTQLYYPPINRSFDEVLKTFGGSVGGSALGNVVSEFLPGLLETVHLKKRE